MIFVFWLMDRPGTAQLRDEVRPIHREYLAKLSDRMAFCGPVFVVLLLQVDPWLKLIGVVVFAVASLTDIYDGSVEADVCQSG